MYFDKETFSKVLTKARQGKGLKQREIAEDLMSRTTYSKIERGIIVPGIVNFYNILSRLNMGFGEFFYLYNKYTLEDRWKIINAFKYTRANTDVEKLTSIKEMCDNFLKNRQDKHITNIKNVCSALLKINENDFEAAKILANKVWDELSNRDTWFFDDIFLINNIFFIFEGDTMEEMYKRAIKYLNKYGEFRNNWGSKIRFSLEFNKLSYDIFYGERPKALEKKIKELIIQARKLCYYDMEAVLFIRLGMIQNDHTLVEKGFSILKVLELSELMASCCKEVAVFESTNNNYTKLKTN
ncbi:helix-turn-helix domain-containing protein [Virgibacillus pantothenticus]|uniref:helix-turn-helix domain-containing protein n=1 Tax=Virgibacillus pantothenticus TaxID=1473 RepID=UPI00147997A1|nr:helix-turn-helix transcriptional regulator [Virgibacillus pantothenticus]